MLARASSLSDRLPGAPVNVRVTGGLNAGAERDGLRAAEGTRRGNSLVVRLGRHLESGVDVWT